MLTAHGTLEAVHEATGLVFVLVPAGSSRLGSEARPDERPVHEVAIPAFLLAKTECTQDAWKRGGGENRSCFTGDGSLPVETVSWSEARGWCKRAALRLPSEAEWEHACRAGTTTPFSTGEEPASLSGFANVADTHLRDHPIILTDRETGYECTESLSDGRAGPAPVGSYRPNPWGLHDVHGNVREWCEDRFHSSYQGAPADGSPWSEGPALTRICRGGGWANSADHARSANRSWESAALTFPDVGLRPAADLP